MWIYLKEYNVAIKNNVADEYIITWKDVHYNEKAGYKLHDPIWGQVCVWAHMHAHTHRKKMGGPHRNARD